MAMTLRLSDEEQATLKARAEAEGVSMQELVRRAIRSYVDDADHRERVFDAAQRVVTAHADALARLGE